MCLKKLVFHQSTVNALALSSVYSILPQCIHPRLISCICVFLFLFTAMHVKSLAFCVWEWRRYTIQFNSIRPSTQRVCFRGGHGTGVDSSRFLRFSFGSGVKNLWKTRPGVKGNFWLVKFLTSRHVRMHRVILYIVAIFVKPQQWPTPSESIVIYCVRKLVSCITHLQSFPQTAGWKAQGGFCWLYIVVSLLAIRKILHLHFHSKQSAKTPKKTVWLSSQVLLNKLTLKPHFR